MLGREGKGVVFDGCEGWCGFENGIEVDVCEERVGLLSIDEERYEESGVVDASAGIWLEELSQELLCLS